MKALRVLLALGIIAACVAAFLYSDGSSTSTASAGALIDLTTSESCRDCHSEVYDEWKSSYHAQSFLDPLVRAKEQSNNFRKVQCIPCHAPAPILERATGKGARVVERFTFREQGVDCLACHKFHDHVAGTQSVSGALAACRPIADERLSRAELCAPCHNQHDTVNEWEASSFHDAGVGCLDCHMPTITRTLPDGRTKQGRSHKFLGGHDLGTLQGALDLKVENLTTDSGEGLLKVSVTNSGAGHNYPADARHRALDLVVTLIQPDGVEVPARDERPPDRQRGTARRRFRNPYRQEASRLTNLETWGRENTQIPSGGTETLEVPYQPEQVVRARIEVFYKLTPYMEDLDSTLVHERVVEL